MFWCSGWRQKRFNASYDSGEGLVVTGGSPLSLSPQTTKSGLVIPEKAQEKVNEATVVAVGGGAKTKVRGRLLASNVGLPIPLLVSLPFFPPSPSHLSPISAPTGG